MTSGTIGVLREQSLISFEDVLVSVKGFLIVLIDLRCCQVSLLSELTDSIYFLTHNSLVMMISLSFTGVKDIVISGLDSHHRWALFGLGFPDELRLKISLILLWSHCTTLASNNSTKGVFSVSL